MAFPPTLGWFHSEQSQSLMTSSVETPCEPTPPIGDKLRLGGSCQVLHLEHELFGLLTPENHSGIPTVNLPNPPVFLGLFTKINFYRFCIKLRLLE